MKYHTYYKYYLNSSKTEPYISTPIELLEVLPYRNILYCKKREEGYYFSYNGDRGYCKSFKRQFRKMFMHGVKIYV